MKTRCDNCGRVAYKNRIRPLAEIPDLGQRLNPGSTVPAGECRKCGALVYLLRKTKLFLAIARVQNDQHDNWLVIEALSEDKVYRHLAEQDHSSVDAAKRAYAVHETGCVQL